MDRHVFISYRRSDSTVVDELIAGLPGHSCWRDTAKIAGGQLWREEITRALDAAYAMILIVSPEAEQSKEVYAEYFYARGREVPVIPFLAANCELPFGLSNINARVWHKDKQQAVEQLRADLNGYRAKAPSLEPINDLHTYLRALQLGYLMAVGNYTPMAGEVRRRREPIARLPQPVVMRPEFSLRRSSALFGNQPIQEERREYEDLLPALRESQRVLILGEPGIGKTTTLFKFADELRLRALEDADAPIPVIVPLREWRGEISWEELMSRHLGVLAPRYQELMAKQWLFLLLDGLNELPRDDTRAAKLNKLRDLVGNGARMVVTCRELDYRDETLKLEIDAITVHPMDPERVLDFLTRYLTDARAGDDGKAMAEKLFWQIAGGIELRLVWEKWRAAGAGLNQFFAARQEPERAGTSWDEGQLWEKNIKSTRNLMHLAANPYLLWMFLQIYLQAGRIPPNRGALFDEFVFQLLKREGLSEGERLTLVGQKVNTRLERLAWFMQRQATESGAHAGGAELTIPRDEAATILGGWDDLYRAASANLLEDAEPVRFAHQLMQEYFAARYMLDARGDEILYAQDLWPQDKWWEPTGWEEVAVLATGMSGNDAEKVIDWLAAANPEVAAMAIRRSGAEFSDRCKLKLREAWLPQMTDFSRQPEAPARAAIGRAMGSVFLARGEPLDKRPGVGLRSDGLPDIKWIDIPGGSVKLENVKGMFIVKPFRIARYLVTNRQFQAFVDAPDGYSNAQWWIDIEQTERPAEPNWKEANSPRENVSWYDAVAFCRWLTEKYRGRGLLGKGHEFRLPTEWEWQQAATGGNVKNTYPWGPEWDAARAKSAESEPLGRTTAVGIYPNGATKQGVLDMAGNVWEWCQNKLVNPDGSRVCAAP
jgi:hypothetical protein